MLLGGVSEHRQAVPQFLASVAIVAFTHPSISKAYLQSKENFSLSSGTELNFS